MEEQTILEGYSEQEKGAYLGAIASIATADRQASQEEIEHLTALAKSAQLSEEQLRAIERAATELSGDELQRCLDVLKNSELKYSLVADLITFAKADKNYSEEEEQNVQKIGQYLGVDQQQFSLLDQFAQNASKQHSQQEEGLQNILGFGGLGEKMKNAGINTGGLLKGLLAVAAPMLISRMMNRGRGGQGGGLGGMLGGSGFGGMLGGGGLGSLISMLSGGRGFGSAGGLLGRILGGRF